MRTKGRANVAIWLGAFTLTIVATNACAHRQNIVAQTAAYAEPPAPVDTVMLEIENHNWSDVIIFINHDGRVDRFADVTATKNVTIPIPPQLQGETGNVTLLVRRIGGTDSYTSPLINVRSGATVRFTIEDVLARSSVGVW